MLYLLECETKELIDMYEIQYQGMNLMDVIATVEVAIDEEQQMVHLYDPHSVVWPEYGGKDKGYVLSDGFFRMVDTFQYKPFFKALILQEELDWLQKIKWIYYKPHANILFYESGSMYTLDLNRNILLYNKYADRLQLKDK